MNTTLYNIDFDKILDQLTYHATSPMIFSSGIFLWLFLGFIIIYYGLKKADTSRILFVTAFSYYFYYKSSGTYFFLLAIVTCSDFYLANCIASTTDKVNKKIFVFFSLLINLGLLVYFKYTNFFAEIIANLTDSQFSPFEIFLPVGISFFTFQSLSYTIDVYRGKITPLDRILDYAFYVSFFPQLVAGPIVRAVDFIPQIRKPLLVTKEMFGMGIYYIISGLFKKAIISDYISVNFVERIFDNPTLYSGVENLMGIYGYALQIYCDFSGYSDMAIGIALLLGFRFNINFDSPYQSASITEFWRRWHISLSSWLRDYLYISLGGNRKGKIRQLINLMITMVLGGLWHGASLNFVIWGTFHGIGLVLHKLFMQIRGRKPEQKSHILLRIGGIILTFHFVCITWIFFRNTNFSNAMSMINQILSEFNIAVLPQLLAGYWKVFALMLLGYIIHFIPKRTEHSFSQMIVKLPFIAKALMILILLFIIIQIKSSDIQPFIYFQF